VIKSIRSSLTIGDWHCFAMRIARLNGNLVSVNLPHNRQVANGKRVPLLLQTTCRYCGYNIVVMCLLAKEDTRVRFPLLAWENCVAGVAQW
jgi:hypothetical protein